MNLELKKIKTQDIEKILNRHSIKYEKDDDGDIKLNQEYPFYIKVDHRLDTIRFFGKLDLDEDVDNLINTLNFVNIGSSTVKYGLMGKKSIMFEYGVIMHGRVNDDYIVNIIKHVESKIDSVPFFIMALSKKLEKQEKQEKQENES